MGRTGNASDDRGDQAARGLAAAGARRLGHPAGAARRLARPPAVARVLQKVAATARRHAMFEPSSNVVVAVSGGVDSLCLLHSMVRLERLLHVRTVCFHFDHGLRPDSSTDAAYVGRQATRLGVPFVIRAATGGPERGESVEAWARDVRYRALLAVLEERGGGVAAVAHTADDQAETVLLALVRGGGLEALSGMRPVARPIVRPLLETTREETEAFCRALRLRPRRDPMNEDASFLRVAVRRRLLPALEEAVGRGVRDTLVRTGTILRQDADLLERMAAEHEGAVRSRQDGDVALLAEALARLDPPIATRIVRRALLDLGLVPEAAHVEAVMRLAGHSAGRAVSLPGGLRARRAGAYVRLAASPPVPPDPARRP